MTRISKANASKLALMIGYKSIEDEIKVAKQHYTDLSTALKPVYEKFCDACTKMPTLWRMNTDYRQLTVEKIKGKPIPQDQVFDQREFVKDLIEVTLPYVGLDRYKNSEVTGLFTNDVIEHVGRRVKFSVSFVDVTDVNKAHKRDFTMYNIVISSANRLNTSYNGANLPINFHKNVKALQGLEKTYTEFNEKLQGNFIGLCEDLFSQIIHAGSIKTLLKEWPECEPFVTRIWGGESEKAIEKPLGNIILKHLKALPQAQA